MTNIFNTGLNQLYEREGGREGGDNVTRVAMELQCFSSSHAGHRPDLLQSDKLHWSVVWCPADHTPLSKLSSGNKWKCHRRPRSKFSVKSSLQWYSNYHLSEVINNQNHPKCQDAKKTIKTFEVVDLPTNLHRRSQQLHP